MHYLSPNSIQIFFTNLKFYTSDALIFWCSHVKWDTTVGFGDFYIKLFYYYFYLKKKWSEKVKRDTDETDDEIEDANIEDESIEDENIEDDIEDEIEDDNEISEE